MTVTRPNLAITSGFLPGEDGWSSAMNDNLDNIDDASGISVAAYGALGDDNADDAAAIQAAHDALPTRGGKLVFTHGKIYRIGTTLNFTKRVVIDGGGKAVDHQTGNVGLAGVVIKKLNTLNGNAITLSGDGSSVSNIAIVGISGNGGDGIQIKGHSIALRHISIMFMGGNGVRIGHSDATNCNIWLLDHVTCRANSGHGCYIHSNDVAQADANAGTSIACSFNINSLNGLRMKNAWFNTFIGLHTETNTQEGIYLEDQPGGGSKFNIFVGGDSEANFEVAGVPTVQVRVTGTGCSDNVFHYYPVPQPGTIVTTGSQRTVINSPLLRLTFPDAQGNVITNEHGNFQWTDNIVSPTRSQLAFYGGGSPRARFGVTPNGPETTDIVATQVVASDQAFTQTVSPVASLHVCARPVNNGSVRIGSGAGLAGYLHLDHGNTKLETNEHFNLAGGRRIEMGEMADPGNASTDRVFLYVDNGGAGGKSRLMARFQSGAAVPVALEP